MNKYTAIKALTALTELSWHGNWKWEKVLPSGNIELHDYDKGFLCVACSIENFDDFKVRLTITNIDDGMLGAWKATGDLEGSRGFLKKVAKVFEHMTALPKLEEINKKLEPLGLKLEYEG